MTKKSREIQEGDYVLATKWGDGDPRDPWAVGFYGGTNGEEKLLRHYVLDSAGNRIRANGYRRVKKISTGRGEWLLKNSDAIELAGRSLYGVIRRPMTEGSV